MPDTDVVLMMEPPPPPAHHGDRRSAEQHQSPKVDPERLVPEVTRDAQQILVPTDPLAAGVCGVVVQDVDGAEALDGPLDERDDLVRLADVGGHGEGGSSG
jgi:hypothetical protein